MRNWAGTLPTTHDRIVRPRTIGEAQELIAARAGDPRARHASFLQPPCGYDRRAALDRAPRPRRRRRRALGDRRGWTCAMASSASVFWNMDSPLRTTRRCRTSRSAARLRRRRMARVSRISRSQPRSRRSTSCSPTGRSTRCDGATTTSTARVVALGALGVVVRITLDVVPAFDLRQTVFERLPWSVVESSLAEILAGAYSVSLFTTWTDAGVEQVWFKSQDEPGDEYFGARAADAPLNPVPGASPENCTGTARRSRPVRRPAAALPARLHAERRRRDPDRVHRRARARARCRRRAPPARTADHAAAPHLGDPRDRRRPSLAESVLRARERRLPLHLEAARVRGARGTACDRRRAGAVRAAAALGQGVPPFAGRELPEAAGVPSAT